MMNVEHAPVPTQPFVNAIQATEILDGFNVNPLVHQHLITPRCSGRGTAFELTAKDVIRAFCIKTLKEENHIRLWSDIRSYMLTPYTEKRLHDIENNPEWSGVMDRAFDFGLNLRETMRLLHEATKAHRITTR